MTLTREPNMLLVRKVAAEVELHERTVLKALAGERSREHVVARKQEAAVKAYNERLAAEESEK
jgi:hypothetical protein